VDFSIRVALNLIMGKLLLEARSGGIASVG
jgi:hypothetical protein